MEKRFDATEQKTYNMCTGCSAFLGTDSQCNERQTRGLATAMQCQKRHHHLNGYLNWFSDFVMVLFLAFLRMLTLQTFKKSLGKRGELLSEVEIKQLFELQYKLADLLFDTWVKQHKPIAAKVTTHKQNGNCVFVWTLNPLYAIA